MSEPKIGESLGLSGNIFVVPKPLDKWTCLVCGYSADVTDLADAAHRANQHDIACHVPTHIVLRDSRGERKLRIVGFHHGSFTCRNIETGRLSYVRGDDTRIIRREP